MKAYRPTPAMTQVMRKISQAGTPSVRRVRRSQFHKHSLKACIERGYVFGWLSGGNGFLGTLTVQCVDLTAKGQRWLDEGE